MTYIPPWKRNRINKKVIPHLKKAVNYWHAEKLERSERELKLAISNYRKEKTVVPEVLHDFASLYNNLGIKYLSKKKLKIAFELFSNALTYKIEYFSSDIKSVSGTCQQLVTAGLLSCKFDELKHLIEKMIDKFADEDKFKTYLTQSLELIEKVQNNEPLMLISGMEIATPASSRRIDDLVHFPEAFEDIEMILASQFILSDHATLECSFVLA